MGNQTGSSGGLFSSSYNLDEQYDKVYRYCYFKLHNRYLAEDITQETFLRFLESDSYQDRGRPLSYLYTIARNLCIDAFRKKREEPLATEPFSSGFEDSVTEKLAFYQAVSSLQEKERELLLLRYVNEVPVSDLGILYGKSRFAIHRELKKIVKKLERGFFDES